MIRRRNGTRSGAALLCFFIALFVIACEDAPTAPKQSVDIDKKVSALKEDVKKTQAQADKKAEPGEEIAADPDASDSEDSKKIEPSSGDAGKTDKMDKTPKAP